MPYRYLAVLFLVTPVSALPVKVESPSGSACLAVLLTLVVILSLLVAFKHAYMKQRRIETAHTRAQSSTPGCSFAADSYYRSTTSFLPSVGSINPEHEKAGFLVGFLGSPAWETRVKSTVGKDVWREHKQSSFMYQLHTESRRRKYSQLRRSSVRGMGSLVNIGQPGSSSISNTIDSRVLCQGRSRSLCLPTYPAKAQIGLPNTSTPRRFSLPSVGRKEIYGVLQQKRHSSLKRARSGRSDISGTFLTGNTSLRLVETMAGLDLPLPLSGDQQHSLIASPLPSLSPTGVINAKSNSRFTRTSIPPLPPLPSADYSSSSLMPASVGLSTLHSPAPIHISHPYALVPNSKYSSQGSLPTQTAPKSLHHCAFSAASEPFRSSPPATPKSDSKLPVISRLPLAAVMSSTLNFSSLEMSFPSPSFLPALSSFPCPPTTSLTIAKPKVKAKHLSARVRRSPTIGPSPLRTMILPDPSDTELGRYTHPEANKENTDFKERPSSIHNAYANLGLGLPTSRSGMETRLDKCKRRQSGMPEHRISQDEDGGGPNILLGIIRELVEETSDWDASLFMDANFKSMIRDSGIVPSKGTEDKVKSSGAADLADSRNKMSTELSEELDLGLLGLDIIRNEDSNCSGSAKYVEGSEIDLVSFWGEGGWVDGNDQRCADYFYYRVSDDGF